MSEQRNAFPTPNTLRQFVQDELNRRRTQFPTPISTPFVRLVSPKSGPNYDFFAMGLHGFIPQQNIFESNYGQGNLVGYGYTAQGSQTLVFAPADRGGVHAHRPAPGITSVKVTHQGPQNPITAEVNWVCYTPAQLDYLRQHFMIAGSYLVLEWGHQTSDMTRNLHPFNFASSDAMTRLAGYSLKGRQSILDAYVQPNQGNYNFIIGQTANYSFAETPETGDGTFQATTRIFSVGENLFGLNTYATYVNTAAAAAAQEAGTEDKLFATSIQDLFKDGGSFDHIIADPQFKNDIVRNIQSQQAPPGDVATQMAAGLSPANHAAIAGIPGLETFVSWNFFLTQMVPSMYSTLQNSGDIRGAALLAKINAGDTEPFVGFNPFLRTTDPHTLVIVNDAAVRNAQSHLVAAGVTTSPPTLFAGKPSFSEVAPGKGKLSQGIWLNYAAIRTAFTTQNTVFTAFTSLLTAINNATANYWDLKLAWDEDTAQYAIHDERCLTPSTVNFYTFNEGTHGELIEWQFEASWSKEMLAQAMLGAAIPKGDVEKQPAIGSADTNIQILNQTSFDDELAVAIDQQQKADQNPIERLLSTSKVSPLTNTVLPLDAVRGQTTPDQANAANQQKLSQRAVAQQQAIDRNTQKLDAFTKAMNDAKDNFTNNLLPYVEVFPSSMMALMKAAAFPATGALVNGYIAPVPTDIELTMGLKGLSGFSMFDAFYLDKIPSMFALHGVFLITEIEDQLAQEGWRTIIHARYYLMWPDGKPRKLQ